ncbi:Hypothetical protein, putative [Bodo saltans]|uniref:Uncharacterized protein n=1 Tax=Bodo saltans TaxID=75058 RepID=A0A0S4J1Q5_BODSA|nr:Hypothetical protein, putative [Bodo saltans]|eukprot:CUG82618.1 Hypothetical protein, putative [Bodo saltans]
MCRVSKAKKSSEDVKFRVGFIALENLFAEHPFPVKGRLLRQKTLGAPENLFEFCACFACLETVDLMLKCIVSFCCGQCWQSRKKYRWALTRSQSRIVTAITKGIALVQMKPGFRFGKANVPRIAV